MDRRPIKLNSARAISAHVYHGWTLCGVFVDPETNQLGESYLVWELPEFPRRPDMDEMKRFDQLFVVEDAFTLADRGTVIAPGIPRDSGLDVRQGDLIVLICPMTERAFTSEVRGIEFFSPPSPRGWPVLLNTGISKDDVPPGTLVWVRSRDRSNSEQGVPPNA
jgi:hypothetical protein